MRWKYRCKNRMVLCKIVHSIREACSAEKKISRFTTRYVTPASIFVFDIGDIFCSSKWQSFHIDYNESDTEYRELLASNTSMKIIMCTRGCRSIYSIEYGCKCLTWTANAQAIREGGVFNTESSTLELHHGIYQESLQNVEEFWTDES